MKYLVFNIVVAGALIYLAVGGDIHWPGAEKAAQATVSSPPAEMPDLEETLAKLKPAIEETATLVAEQVSEDVTTGTKEELSSRIAELEQKIDALTADRKAIVDAPAQTSMIEEKTPTEEQVAEDLPPLPTMTVDVPVVHTPMEDPQGPKVAQAPAQTEPTGQIPVESATPQVQLAEGSEMMSPRERQRELDALVQNMELMFLDKAGE